MSRKMKDSGVVWIGDIPKEWRVIRAKWLFSQRISKGNDSLILLAATQKKGMIPQSELEGVVKVAEGTDLREFKTVQVNDFVISLRSFQGGFELSKYAGVCSPAYQVFYAKSKCGFVYYKYLFKSLGFIQMINSLTVGIREGKNIQYSNFANELLPIPPVSIQTQIGIFLDIKCAEIDKVVEKTRESIEEYKKLKQAVITEAVTKGVRGPRPMKNSDDQWWPHLANSIVMSRVGLHYDIILGKMLSSSPSNESDDLLPYYCAANIHFNKIDRALNLKKMWFSQEEASKLSVQKGDLLVVEGGAGAGGSAVVASTDGIVCIQNSVMIVRSRNCNSAKYLMYVVESLVKRGYIDITCNKATIPHFTKDKLSNTRIPMWESSEQQEIADYLDAKCEEIDRLISKKEQLIAELEAYKKSLIYEYVTGKKEVPA